MRGIPRLLLAPIMRLWVSFRELELATVPRPDDAAEAQVGEGGDAILVIGSCVALGWGVATNDLAIPGALARAVSTATGRGTSVRTVAEATLGPRAIFSRLGTLEIERYDTIVLTLGLYRALRLGPLRTWERDLRRLLTQLDSMTRADVRVVVAGVHPIRAISIFNSALGDIADAHARAMNKITKRICADIATCVFVDMTARDSRDLKRIRTAADYRHYGELLARHITAPSTRRASGLSQS